MDSSRRGSRRGTGGGLGQQIRRDAGGEDQVAPPGGRTLVGPTWRRPLPGLPQQRWRTAIMTGTVAVLMVYTAAAWALPELRVSWSSSTSRILLESIELSIALFAAQALLLPDDGDTEVARNAFVTALVVLGVSNLVFGVGPLLLGTTAAFGGVLSFYPWVATRYVVGLLFIAAALGRPRMGLGWFLGAVLATLVAVDLVLLAVRDRLPSPFVELEFSPGGVVVPVTSLPQELVIAVVPAVLFGVGAWLAGRVFAHGASPLYWFLALGLTIQSFAKIHEALYPTVLGPRITSADLLRAVFILLLLLGAVTKVRQVVLDRGAAVEALAGDLETGQQLLGRMRAFTEQEAAFRSLVVHELATPLATLRAFAHVLADPRAGEGPRQRAHEGLAAESRRLQQLIQRMDELRALELDEFAADLRPVRLRSLIDDLATYVRGLPGGHRPVLRWGCDEDRVDADPVRLGQALRNIATNAARYSPEHSLIVIECGEIAPDRVEVAITDQGPGIPADERERVLRRFERGNAGGGGDGMGLGLHVAARIAEAHGGRVTIADGRDDLARGARVALELPMST